MCIRKLRDKLFALFFFIKSIFLHDVKKKEKISRVDFISSRFVFENIRTRFASDDVALQMCAYFSFKNGLAEVAGENVYLEHLFLSRSVISSCLSQHH